jgi:hypothetical protein
MLRLEYTREKGAEHCPDEDGVRDFLTGEFKYVPVDPAAELTLEMSAAVAEGKVRIDVHLKDAQGNTFWEEPVEGDEECAILIRRSALKVYIQTVIATSPAPGSPAPPSPPLVAPPAAPAAVLPAARLPSPPAPHGEPPARRSASQSTHSTVGAGYSLRVQVALLGQVHVGITPSVSAGGSVMAGFRLWRLGLELDARAAWSFVPAVQTIVPAVQTRASSRFIGATIAPCYYHKQYVFGCATFNIGVLDVMGVGLTSGDALDRKISALGPRIGFEYPIAARVAFVRATLEISAAIDKAGFHINRDPNKVTDPAWETPPVFGALGAGIVAIF